MNYWKKYLKIKKKAAGIADKCLLIGAVSVITGGVYFNMLYYARQRNKQGPGNYIY